MAEKPEIPSKERINRAGDRIRAMLLGDVDPGDLDLRGELRVVEAFRDWHADPLKKVSANLRYYVAKHSTVSGEGGHGIVAQRLKRMTTIADKLVREPGMKLSRMEDVGGCRALLANVEELHALVRDIAGQSRWQIVRQRDYIETPKDDSGYRAHHLIVNKDGRRIEIQLRTVSQHEWAELVEATDRSSGVGLKAGRAPASVTEYYRLGAELLAGSESGAPTDPGTLEAFRRLHDEVTRLTDRTNR